jgi:hypothetical protein
LQVRDQNRLGLLQPCDGRLPAHGWKVEQKIVKGLPLFEVIQQILKRNASVPENRSSSENVRVFNDDVFHFKSPRPEVYNQCQPGRKSVTADALSAVVTSETATVAKQREALHLSRSTEPSSPRGPARA